MREALAAPPFAAAGRLEEDDFGDARYAVRMSISQLDADAMNDRLQAFVHREAEKRLPGASAGVSYHFARPDDSDAGDLDLEDVWHGVEAVFRLDLHAHPVTPEGVAEWASLLPRFHQVVNGSGRPAGWRPDVHAGSSE